MRWLNRGGRERRPNLTNSASLLLILGAAFFSACTTSDPLYCDDQTPCAADYYCNFEKKTCEPVRRFDNPAAEAGVIEKAPLLDVSATEKIDAGISSNPTNNDSAVFVIGDSMVASKDAAKSAVTVTPDSAAAKKPEARPDSKIVIPSKPDVGPPPKSVNGAACSSGATCQSGFCVEGVCCNSACNQGECQSCKLASTIGTCSFKPKGTLCGNPRACITTADSAYLEHHECVGNAATCQSRREDCAGPKCTDQAGNALSQVEYSVCGGGNGAPAQCARATKSCGAPKCLNPGLQIASYIERQKCPSPTAFNCVTVKSYECGGYKCNDNATCKTACASNDECHTGICEIDWDAAHNNKCAAPSDTCFVNQAASAAGDGTPGNPAAKPSVCVGKGKLYVSVAPGTYVDTGLFNSGAAMQRVIATTMPTPGNIPTTAGAKIIADGQNSAWEISQSADVFIKNIELSNTNQKPNLVVNSIGKIRLKQSILSNGAAGLMATDNAMVLLELSNITNALNNGLSAVNATVTLQESEFMKNGKSGIYGEGGTWNIKQVIASANQQHGLELKNDAQVYIDRATTNKNAQDGVALFLAKQVQIYNLVSTENARGISVGGNFPCKPLAINNGCLPINDHFVVNATIADNKVNQVTCGASYMALRLQNSILWGQTSNHMLDGSCTTCEYSDVSEPCPDYNQSVQGTNMTVNPEFKQIGVMKLYEIKKESSLIDIGNDAFVPLDKVPLDNWNNPRKIGSHIDIGAYEAH